MADELKRIDQDIRGWINRQHLFFVASAPLAGDGFVNCSPKGLDSLRVVDDHTLAYLDLTGSGVETVAHVNENGRILIMLCAFEGPPRIMRFHGAGEVLVPGTVEFSALIGDFPPMEGVRSIIRVTVSRISSSCGYGVPLMDFKEDRRALPAWVDKRGAAGIVDYQRTVNAESLDGLAGVNWLK